MNKRIGVLLAAVFLLVAPSGLIAASFDPLLPLLVDLAGWQAEKAEGIDLGQAGMKSVSVFREYTSGEKGLSAAILLGSQVGASWMPDYREGYKVESSEGTMEVGKINGFLVYRGFDKDDSSGGIMVLLIEAAADKPESGAVFFLTFDGVALEEALKLAQKFDWKKIKDAAARVK
jgi:hypothetical protein